MLNPDFRDMVSEFCAAGVEFLLVGAYAMAAHDVPRTTGDLDLWVRCSEENAPRVLARFGAPLAQVSAADFQTPGVVFEIGVAPRRVDILTTLDGVAFEEVWRDRVEIDVEGLRIPVISRAHLLQNKRASGRPKDMVDVQWLEDEGA